MYSVCCKSDHEGYDRWRGWQRTLIELHMDAPSGVALLKYALNVADNSAQPFRGTTWVASPYLV
jgi:hypothetical protein